MNEFKAYYIKNKNYLIPGLFIFLSLFLSLFVILPQFSSTNETRRLIDEENKKLSILKDNLDVIETQQDETVDDNLTISTTALPTSKDVSLIFSALSSAATESNIVLKEFSLKVGGIYGRAVQMDQSPGSKFPSIVVMARAGGSDGFSISKFLKTLQKKIPLSDVTKVTSSDGEETFDIVFYYKPPNLDQLREEEKIKPLTAKEAEILNKLKSWSR